MDKDNGKMYRMWTVFIAVTILLDIEMHVFGLFKLFMCLPRERNIDDIGKKR